MENFEILTVEDLLMVEPLVKLLKDYVYSVYEENAIPTPELLLQEYLYMKKHCELHNLFITARMNAEFKKMGENN